MIGKWLNSLAGALMVLAATGCAGGPRPIGNASSVRAIEGAMPAPSTADFARPVRDFYLGPGDKLKVNVFGVPELSGETQIDGAGQLSFPLIGIVDAAGQTPAQVAQTVEDRLQGRYVKDPQVTVNVEDSLNQTLTVDGQVARPGMYPVTGRMTLERAVAVAGGASELANLRDVLVRREVGDQTYIGMYNLDAIRRGNYADPEVFPSDVIIVGDSSQRRLFRDILQIVPLLTTPLILLLQK